MTDLSNAPLEELVEGLRRRGVRIELEAGKPKIKGWRKVSPPEREKLRAQREALIALLRSDEKTLEPPRPKPAQPEEPARKLSPGRRRLEAVRRMGPRGFNRRGRQQYAAMLDDYGIPESEMTRDELLLMREQIAKVIGAPYPRRR